MKHFVGRVAVAIVGGVLVMGAAASSWAADLVCKEKNGQISLTINTDTGAYLAPFSGHPRGFTKVFVTDASYSFEIKRDSSIVDRVIIDRSTGNAFRQYSSPTDLGTCVAVKPPKL